MAANILIFNTYKHNNNAKSNLLHSKNKVMVKSKHLLTFAQIELNDKQVSDNRRHCFYRSFVYSCLVQYEQ
jgi:hypothetical protein